MDHLQSQSTFELALKGVKVCRNCTHWMDETACPNAPVTKWWQRKTDTWCKLATCNTFTPCKETKLALMHLTQRRLKGEPIRLNQDDEE